MMPLKSFSPLVIISTFKGIYIHTYILFIAIFIIDVFPAGLGMFALFSIV